MLYRNGRIATWCMPILGVTGIFILPVLTSTVVIIAAVVLGIAHGAADYDIPRALGRQRAAAVAGILAVYVAALAAAYFAFVQFPPFFFAIFLLLSWWHFGNGDARYEADAPLGPHLARDWIVRGAVPLIFGAVPLAAPTAAMLLAVLAGLLILDHFLRGRTLGQMFDVLLPAAICAASPYVIGFLMYFALWHAPRHIMRVVALYVERTDGSSTRNACAWFATRALPTIGVCFGGIAGCIAVHAAITPTRIVAAIFAVTVPHEWIIWLMNRRSAERGPRMIAQSENA